MDKIEEPGKKKVSFSGVFLKNVRKPSFSFFFLETKAAAPTTTNDYELKTNPFHNTLELFELLKTNPLHKI